MEDIKDQSISSNILLMSVNVVILSDKYRMCSTHSLIVSGVNSLSSWPLMEVYGHCLSHSYGEVGPRYRAAGISDVYPLSSTVLPGHTTGDRGTGGVIEVEGGATLDSGAQGGITEPGMGASNSPDGKTGIDPPCDQQSAASSDSVTLSPSDTLNADELCTFSLTEVSQNSTLLALARATEDEAPGALALEGAVSMGEQQAREDTGVQKAGKNTGVQRSAKVQEVSTSTVVQTIAGGLEGGEHMEVLVNSKITRVQKITKTMEDRSIDTNRGAQGIGVLDTPSQPPAPPSVVQISKEDICQIVRKEIEPMLQVSTDGHPERFLGSLFAPFPSQHQHKQLLGALQEAQRSSQEEYHISTPRHTTEGSGMDPLESDGVAEEDPQDDTESTLPPVNNLLVMAKLKR